MNTIFFQSKYLQCENEDFVWTDKWDSCSVLTWTYYAIWTTVGQLLVWNYHFCLIKLTFGKNAWGIHCIYNVFSTSNSKLRMSVKR